MKKEHDVYVNVSMLELKRLRKESGVKVQRTWTDKRVGYRRVKMVVDNIGDAKKLTKFFALNNLAAEMTSANKLWPGYDGGISYPCVVLYVAAKHCRPARRKSVHNEIARLQSMEAAAFGTIKTDHMNNLAALKLSGEPCPHCGRTALALGEES